MRDRKTPSQGRNTDHTQSCMMGKSSDVTASLPDLSNTTGAHFTPLCTARSCCSHPLQTTPGPFADLSLREKENQGDNKGQRHTQKKREIFFKTSINIHCIDVSGDFMSAVCQTGASVNKTPSARVGAHQSNISTRIRTPPPFLCDWSGVGSNSWLPSHASGCVRGAVMIGSLQRSGQTQPKTNRPPQSTMGRRTDVTAWKTENTHTHTPTHNCSTGSPLGV